MKTILTAIIFITGLNACRTQKIKEISTIAPDQSTYPSTPTGQSDSFFLVEPKPSDADETQFSNAKISHLVELASSERIDQSFFLSQNLLCGFSSRIIYSEKTANYEGDWNYHSYSQPLNFNPFYAPVNSKSFIHQNLLSKGAFLLVSVNLVCDNLFSSKSTGSGHIYLKWKCAIPEKDFPQIQNTKTSALCDSKNLTYEGIIDFKKPLLNAGKDYQFYINIHHKGSVKKFDFSNCSHKKNQIRHYFQITQGLGKQKIDRNFHLDIDIDGVSLPGLQKIASENGTYSLNIQYCTQVKKPYVSFYMNAYETTNIVNTKFKPQKDPLKLAPGEVGFFSFSRDTIVGWLIPFFSQEYQSDIRVEYMASFEED